MTIPVNPYVAGNPVGGSPAFIGRADVLGEVGHVLRRPQDNAIVLFGQRRIGKTSILEHLAARLPDEGPYRTVYFDLQDKADWPLNRVLRDLVRTIAHALSQTDPDLGSDLESTFRQEWLPSVLNDLPEGCSLVLLFDEFDVLADPQGEQAAKAFFPYLRGLLARDPERLQFVFIIGRNVDDLDTIALSLFKGTPYQRVSLLGREDTADLVRLSEANDTLRWPDEAMERVWQLTNGHPFLTQQLCSHVWERAYDEDDEVRRTSEVRRTLPAISPQDVDVAVPDVLEASRNTLEWLWDGLPPAERVVASALAEAGPGPITQEGLERLLHESGVRVLTRELQNAPQLLEGWDRIEPADGGHRFRVELLRCWIAEYRPLRRVQEELDRIEPVADSYYQAALGLYRGGQLDQAIATLSQAINLNPNHVRANQLLADILLAQGQVNEARRLLERLHEYQPAARPRLVQALLAEAQVTESNDERLALYERVLDLEAAQPEAIGKVAEIKQEMRRRELATRLQELEALKQERRYQDALDLARKLADEYPGMRNWTPDLERLERKTLLVGLYQRALEALQSGDQQTAQTLLAEVIALEPGYEEAARYLHMAMADPLSPWNPLDHLRLFWWVLVTPQQLKAYRETFGEEDERKVGKWLASTLTWLPLFIPTLALGLGTLPRMGYVPSPTAYLWSSLGLALAWVLTGWLGKSDDDVAAAVATIVAVAVAFIVAFVVLAGMAVDVAVGVTQGVAVGVAFVVGGVAASGVAHAIADDGAVDVAFVVAVIMASIVVVVLVVVLAVVAALVVADSIAFVVADSMALVVVGVVAGVVAGVVVGVMVFRWAAGMAAAVVAGVAEVAESAGRALGISLLAHAFLIWFSFLGGWRVFQRILIAIQSFGSVQ